MIKKLTAFLFFSLCFIVTMAQNGADEKKPEMADLMRSNGKIYVVVAVVLTILIGIFVYLIRLDGKIRKLEKNLN